MKRLLFVLAACSSKPAPAPQQPTPPAGVVKDTRTPLEQRRDAACDVVGKRTAACAVQDSKAQLAAGKITQDAYNKATEPAVVAKDAEVYADKCKAKRDYSSRQIRVLEMCPKYESECEPFLACLQNLQPSAK
ncbi:MAG: hypothetical protein JO257_35725 [Deltaproteobacteria bacterium]|nr:hypothetical protein [Deltaproteobacteria bacterium]